VKTASCYLAVLSKISCIAALVSPWKFNTQQLFPHRNSQTPVHSFFQEIIKISTKEIRTISFQSPDCLITIGSVFKNQLMKYPLFCVKNVFIRKEKYFSRSEIFIDVPDILPLPYPKEA